MDASAVRPLRVVRGARIGQSYAATEWWNSPSTSEKRTPDRHRASEEREASHQIDVVNTGISAFASRFQSNRYPTPDVADLTAAVQPAAVLRITSCQSHDRWSDGEGWAVGARPDLSGITGPPLVLLRAGVPQLGARSWTELTNGPNGSESAPL